MIHPMCENKYRFNMRVSARAMGSRDRSPSGDQGDDEAYRAVAELVDGSLSCIRERMPALKGSLLGVARVSGKGVRGFAHPTSAGALPDILKDRSYMIATLLRGAPVNTIMNGYLRGR